MKQNKRFVLLLALVMLFSMSSLAAAQWCPPPPAPVVYTDGTADAKIDQYQDAKSVSGLVTTVDSEKGLVNKVTDSTTISGSGAFGINDFSGSSGNWHSQESCFKEGAVGVGRFTYSNDTVHTNGFVFVDNKTTANVVQNLNTMTSSQIASASACGLPVKAIASQGQSYTVDVVNASMPGISGTLSTHYSGNTSANIKLGNY